LDVIIWEYEALLSRLGHQVGAQVIQPNRVYSREEAAELLMVSVSLLKRLIASGALTVSRPPGMRRVLVSGQRLLELRPGI
jgi:excisionase family DNA binding protein